MFCRSKKSVDTINKDGLFHKLIKYNIKGSFFNILKDMYKDVSFSVKLKEGLTQTFPSCVGLKQVRCILSPTLFSLYINELVEMFDHKYDPACLDNKQVSCFLLQTI